MFDMYYLKNKNDSSKNFDHFLKKNPYSQCVEISKDLIETYNQIIDQSKTDMVWVITGNNLVEDFSFDFKPDWKEEYDFLFNWSTKNPLNGLIYYHSGIKLVPRKKINVDFSNVRYFTPMKQIGSVLNFNTSPFSTWKTAFTEAAILSKKTDAISKNRLEIWMNMANGQYSDFCVHGAKHGYEYSMTNDLTYIYDEIWLGAQYDKYF